LGWYDPKINKTKVWLSTGMLACLACGGMRSGMRVGPHQHIENNMDNFKNGLDFCPISPFMTPKTAL
jgi:hypothetical protein